MKKQKLKLFVGRIGRRGSGPSSGMFAVLLQARTPHSGNNGFGTNGVSAAYEKSIE